MFNFSRLTNGQRESNDHNSRDRLWMMMGASLNPSSSMSEELDSVLKHELQCHSVYESSMQTTYHQVPLPGGKRSHTTVKKQGIMVFFIIWLINIFASTLKYIICTKYFRKHPLHQQQLTQAAQM